jgi:hypothetical protein
MNQYSKRNNVKVIGEFAELLVCNENGDIVARPLIDLEDVNRVLVHRWHLTSNGYIASRIDGRIITLQRFILNIEGKREGDHINRDILDNRKSNLRPCSDSQNKMNRPMQHDNKTGYKGVSYCNYYKKWRATINKNRKQISVGYFKNPLDAALAYNEAAKRLHGEFAYLNAVGN